MGHSPADPENERGRKDEKMWARAEQDPVRIFEEKYTSRGVFTEDELKAARKEVMAKIKEAVQFSDESTMPKGELAFELEYPDAIDTDYNARPPPYFAQEVNQRTISPEQMVAINEHLEVMYAKSNAGELTIAEAMNLAIHEEMLRDPTTTMHAEDLQARSSCE